MHTKPSLEEIDHRSTAISHLGRRVLGRNRRPPEYHANVLVEDIAKISFLSREKNLKCPNPKDRIKMLSVKMTI